MATITPLPEDRATVIASDVAAANAADSQAMLEAFLNATSPSAPTQVNPAASDPVEANTGVGNVHQLHPTTPAPTTKAPQESKKPAAKKTRSTSPRPTSDHAPGPQRIVVSLPHALSIAITERCAITQQTKTALLVQALEATWDHHATWYHQPSGRFPAAPATARTTSEPMRHSEFPLTTAQVTALDARVSELGAPSRSEFVTRVLREYLSGEGPTHETDLTSGTDPL